MQKMDWGVGGAFIGGQNRSQRTAWSQSLFKKKINYGVRLGGESFKSQTLNLSAFYATWRQECTRQDVLKPLTAPQPCRLLSVTPLRCLFGTNHWKLNLQISTGLVVFFFSCHLSMFVLWEFIRSFLQCLISHRWGIKHMEVENSFM